MGQGATCFGVAGDGSRVGCQFRFGVSMASVVLIPWLRLTLTVLRCWLGCCFGRLGADGSGAASGIGRVVPTLDVTRVVLLATPVWVVPGG